MVAPTVAIVTDDPGWHGRELRAAFTAREVASSYVSLMDCHVDLSGPGAAIVIPGFGSRLPDGVFVRGVPGGTLEQVILRLDILHWLKDDGVVVYNDGRAIERTVDKAMTSFLLKRAGIPTPKTWICESHQHARVVVMRETALGNRIVIKPLFGSQGVGIALLQSPSDLPDSCEFGDVFYLQTFIEGGGEGWCDWRVFVIGGRAQAAMLRSSDHWITNRARGAVCKPASLDSEVAELAEAAARAVDIDYAGIDLMRDSKGQYYVTEINSIPAWRGLQDVSAFNIAGRIVDHFLARLGVPEIKALT